MPTKELITNTSVAVKRKKKKRKGVEINEKLTNASNKKSPRSTGVPNRAG